jgi:hypothetical protein
LFGTLKSSESKSFSLQFDVPETGFFEIEVTAQGDEAGYDVKKAQFRVTGGTECTIGSCSQLVKRADTYETTCTCERCTYGFMCKDAIMKATAISGLPPALLPSQGEATVLGSREIRIVFPAQLVESALGTQSKEEEGTMASLIEYNIYYKALLGQTTAEGRAAGAVILLDDSTSMAGTYAKAEELGNKLAEIYAADGKTFTYTIQALGSKGKDERWGGMLYTINDYRGFFDLQWKCIIAIGDGESDARDGDHSVDDAVNMINLVGEIKMFGICAGECTKDALSKIGAANGYFTVQNLENAAVPQLAEELANAMSDDCAN